MLPIVWILVDVDFFFFFFLDVDFLSLDFSYRNFWKVKDAHINLLKPGNTFELKILGHTFFRCGIDVPQRYYYQFRSAYYIFKKYKNFYCFAFHVYKFFKVILFFKNKAEYIRMMHMGIYDAKRGFFGNISERPNNCS